MASLQTAVTNKQTAATGCPKCGKPLTDAAGLGWCPACGYCRTLEETPSKAELEPETPVSPLNEMGLPAEPRKEFLIPVWSILLVLGMAGLATGSYFVGKNLAPNSFPRALWTSIQIAVGILTLFAGQFAALIYVAPFDEKLGFKDALMPLRLYGHVFQRLPRMSFSVLTLGYGLTLIVAALFFIGGLDHWFVYLKNNRDKAGTTTQRR